MLSLLLVTQDLKAEAMVDRFAGREGLRLRSVAEFAAALEWATKQHFELLLVDAALGVERVVELLMRAWEKNPLLIVSVFDTQQTTPQDWEAIVLGARVFCGERALEHFGRFLTEVVKVFPLDGEKHSTVLLVEDLDAPRDIISAYIQALGIKKVVAVGSAPEALIRLRERPLDFFCVLTDINMPGSSGIDLIREIRADKQLKHLPIVVLTAYATPEHLVACLREGVSGFLTKPPQKKSLRQELEKARRMVLFRQTPQLCSPEDSELLEDTLSRMSLRLR